MSVQLEPWSPEPLPGRGQSIETSTICAAGAAALSCRPARFRKLSARHRAWFHQHLLRLPPSDRRLRFCGGVSDAFIDRYVETYSFSQALLIGYIVEDELRGVAELIRLGHPGRDTGEVALTVEAGYQGRGVGTELLRRLVPAARIRRVRWLRMAFLPENRRMRSIARKFGARLSFDHGLVQGRLGPFPRPTCADLLAELRMSGWCG